MPKKSSKPKYPSYEDGELRDPKIAEKLDPKFSESDLKRAIKIATEKSS
jgi:hypothetical protein